MHTLQLAARQEAVPQGELRGVRSIIESERFGTKRRVTGAAQKGRFEMGGRHALFDEIGDVNLGRMSAAARAQKPFGA